MKRVLLLTLLLTAAALRGDERRLVRIHIDRPEQAQALIQRDLDLASRHIARYADAVLCPAEELALQKEGYRLEPLTSTAALSKTAVALSGDMGAYHTYQELSEELAALAESYPDILRLTSIGRSIEGREIWAVKLSDNPGLEEADEAEVLFTAAIHAREIITPEILLDFIHHLTTLYGQDSLLTRLVNERQIWLIPMLNPDGHVRVENGDLWYRKNCRVNADRSVGVDLNRNFGFKWGYDNYGSSPIPKSETYRGSGPFSEPETAALRDFAAAHRFSAVINYHSYSQLILFPWSYVEAHTGHHPVFMELARNLASASGYPYGDSAMGLLYLINGDSDDYFYGVSLEGEPCFSFTIEVGTAFHPPESEMSQLIAVNRPANLYLAYIADKLRRDPWRIVPPDSSGEDSTMTNIPLAGLQATEGVPATFRLAQNYPNPFNAATAIPYSLTRPAFVRLTLCDALGRPLRTLLAENRPAGEHRLAFNANGLPSGIYFCRMEAIAVTGPDPTLPGPCRGESSVIRMLLLR
jgi:hypothetical protein